MKNIFTSWQQYKYRFVPWIAMNIRRRKVRNVKSPAEDKIISDEEATKSLQIILKALEQNSIKGSVSMSAGLMHSQNLEILKDKIGFNITKSKSVVKSGGTGVIVNRGMIKKGSIAALYPGTLYRQGEPLFFQSLGNSFIFRCIDGIHIDGSDKFISRLIYRSLCGRDMVGPYHPCDTTWLTDEPLNPLNIGQYVNNQTKDYPANVAYQELDLKDTDLDIVWKMNIPNIYYAASTEYNKRPLRLVLLVALRDIHQGEELFSSYFTIVK